MAGDALTFRVAFVVRWLLWVVRFVVIWPLATMALMALFVLWKDNTTPGKLLVKEINFVRQTAPAGQFPVSECWFSSSDSSGRSEIQDICHYRAADAADYVRVNRPDFPGECFICELRLPDHCFRWKHNKLFLLLPE
ncbi:conjugal transfer pilus-stabilizing protein TraP, partial [Escherichia coli]|uniref:conjugal transfer pilus-stabilizing protein TraP n=1 Tax=Escherichia coli TaxID=562 RepID=UPI00201F79FB